MPAFQHRPMCIIAKMNCTSIEDYGWSRKIKFNAVHDSGINIGATPENIAFTKATPNGEAWMTVDNENVWPAFHPPYTDDDLEKPENRQYKPASQHYVVFIDANEHSLDDVHKALAALNEA